MFIRTLPDAIQREREALLRDAVDILKIEGNRDFFVQDLAGYKEPDELNIPVLNVHMRPDIFAANQMGDSQILGIIEVSSNLGEKSCGRRWKALIAWAHKHNSRMQVFVHPEDLRRATDIAQYWHVNPEFIIPVRRAH